jgi:DNA-binding transcriptional MerR regulator
MKVDTPYTGAPALEAASWNSHEGSSTSRSSAPAPGDYTIRDLAGEFGVTLRTLRFYEDRGLLQPRREGATRIYDARDRARLGVILKGKQLGFTLTEIRAMLEQEGDRPTPAADLKLSLAQVEDQIAHLERQMADISQALEELRETRAGLLNDRS